MWSGCVTIILSSLNQRVKRIERKCALLPKPVCLKGGTKFAKRAWALTICMWRGCRSLAPSLVSTLHSHRLQPCQLHCQNRQTCLLILARTCRLMGRQQGSVASLSSRRSTLRSMEAVATSVAAVALLVAEATVVALALVVSAVVVVLAAVTVVKATKATEATAFRNVVSARVPTATSVGAVASASVGVAVVVSVGVAVAAAVAVEEAAATSGGAVAVASVGVAVAAASVGVAVLASVAVEEAAIASV
mmetsp:Transcript_63599/g.141851  ORF Transcript_63599/g.141851 Transcript_63599/m.141851 type:complete len:248 (-) Transcript_63599:84-827(-)